MKIKISSEWPYQLLFFIALLFSYVNMYEVSFAVWLFVLVVTIRRYYSKSIVTYCSIFALIAIIGVIRAFFYDHSLYNILRDISYFVKPIVGLLIGYQCFRSADNNFFKTIVYCATGIAIIHLSILFFSFLIFHIRTIHEIREHGGYFSDFEAYALIILLFSKKFNLNFSFKKKAILLTIITVSLCLYLARTNMIQVFILGCGMLGLFEFSKKKMIAFLAFCLVAGIGYKVIYDMNPARRGTGFEAFLYKIKNAPKEIYDPYVINDNSSRFHDNFRSYETKTTIQQVAYRDDLGIWLGNGFGSTVNYGSLIGTNDGTLVRHAPILHNGYTTVFLKTGILGLILYIISTMFLSFYGKKTEIKYLNNIKLLINSSGIFLFISTLVFLGYYLKLDNKSLFIGGLLAYYEIIKNEQKG